MNYKHLTYLVSSTGFHILRSLYCSVYTLSLEFSHLYYIISLSLGVGGGRRVGVSSEKQLQLELSLLYYDSPSYSHNLEVARLNEGMLRECALACACFYFMLKLLISGYTWEHEWTSLFVCAPTKMHISFLLEHILQGSYTTWAVTLPRLFSYSANANG